MSKGKDNNGCWGESGSEDYASAPDSELKASFNLTPTTFVKLVHAFETSAFQVSFQAI